MTCDGCGVCCMHMAIPPYDHEELDSLKELHPEVYADYRAVTITRDLEYQVTRNELTPCGFFDLISRKCRHHDVNPDICARFEVGGEFCLEQRREAGVDEAIRRIPLELADEALPC